jgi:L-cysteine:1D-myo-inositol 2-amino-2-deoxy-alpha-D-glucopyranoside ligase
MQERYLQNVAEILIERVKKIHSMALVWLTSKPDQPTWQRPFGFSRPGWHIECSAIALHYLDTSQDASECSIDFQGGGSDLIFPHHEMSAPKVASFLENHLPDTTHVGMIGHDGEKMSKSLGNLVFVSRLIAEGSDPMAIRWALRLSLPRRFHVEQ